MKTSFISAYNLEALAQTNGTHEIIVNTSKEFYALHDYLVFTLGWDCYEYAHVSQDGSVTINIRVSNNQPEPTNPDNTPSTMNAKETKAPEFSELSHTATSAICPLDFDTTFDAYNYAMAHRLDESPLAVAIPTDAHGTDYGRSLALNGVKLFAVWSDELEETANGYVYTTEAGAREAMAQVEDNDKEAGVYEPNYWKVSDMTKYFA